MNVCPPCGLFDHTSCEEDNCECICGQLKRTIWSPEDDEGGGVFKWERPSIWHLWFEGEDICIRHEEGDVFKVKPGQVVHFKAEESVVGVSLRKQEDDDT